MKLKLELTVEETNLILNAVGQLPYYQVNDLVRKIQNQASVQVQAMQQAKVEANKQAVEQN